MNKPMTMMSDSYLRHQAEMAYPGGFDARGAKAEAQRVLAATESEDREDGLGDRILGWPYQDTPADMRRAVAEALAAAVADGGLLDRLAVAS